jgi:glutamate synthase (NADPH/NADH) small chain
VGDEQGRVRGLKTVKVGPPPKFEPIAGSEQEFPADLVLLAMGFTGPVKSGLLTELEVALDARGNVQSGENHMTSIPGVFAAGDMRRGQSLVVWAIAEGRKAATGIHNWLKNS